MDFAAGWLERNALFPEIIHEQPDPQTGIIVVVPSFNEPGISVLLDSLASCDVPGCKAEVLLIINAPAGARREEKLNNSISINNIEGWKRKNKSFFRLYFFDAGQPSIKGWGVGTARKTGMDEAVRRFNLAGNPEGVIACLDADCLVEKNYFTALESELAGNRRMNGCSIYFEHLLSGEDFTGEIRKNIVEYELHMRYYIQGLKYSGFPYAFHTVGSSFAVKALKYVKCGGMNRRQAGEDFYFLQKLIPLGGYFNLNSTTVYPSPRESSRVPFGTGPVMKMHLKRPSEDFLTYNPEAFTELRFLFSSAIRLYQCNYSGLRTFYGTLPSGLRSYISEQEWMSRNAEIRENTSGSETYTKRFFGWFNMFRIVKYLNHVHRNCFIKQPVREAALSLLEKLGGKAGKADIYFLLTYYRAMEKNK
ncbi:MAG: hypothetical protein ABSG89_11665 [Bacteroidales bacterium]|jgi:hypothetical protein